MKYLKKFKYLKKIKKEETWSLDVVIAAFLISRLKKYKDCVNVIDWDCHKFINPADSKEYNLKEVIEYIIENLYNYIENGNFCDDSYLEVQNALVLFAKIFPYLWW